MSMIGDIRLSRGTVVITWDDGFSLRVAKKHFEMHPLSVGEDAEPEAYADSVASTQLGDAYEAALSMLDRSDKTEKKLTEALVTRGYVPAAAAAAVERLREVGLVNDGALAKRMAEGLRNRPVGVYAAKQRLRAKGVSDEDAEAALATLTDEQQLSAAREAAAKFARKYRELPAPEARRKLSQALARRGFGWDIISSVLAESGMGDDWDQ